MSSAVWSVVRLQAHCPGRLAATGISVRVASEVEMPRTRPCRICRRWFRPHPRAGDRQKVCSGPGCQRERHRRNCAAWRSKEQESIRRERLKRAIIKPAEEVPEFRSGHVHARVRWDWARDSVGLEASVITEEIVKLIDVCLRDSVSPYPPEMTWESHKHPHVTAQDVVRPPQPDPRGPG